MGDENDGGAELGMDALQLGPHLQPQTGIEVRQRLIQKQDAGIDRQHPRQSHALLLAARQLAGIAVAVLLDVQRLHHLCHARLALGLGHLAQPQAKVGVPLDRQVRPERIGLEHQPHPALFRAEEATFRRAVNHLIAHADLAAGQALKPRDHAQRRGLSAARGAQQAHELAVADLQVQVVHGQGRCTAVGFLHIAESDVRHQVPSPSARLVRVSFWASSVPR